MSAEVLHLQILKHFNILSRKKKRKWQKYWFNCNICFCTLEPEIRYLAYLELEVTSSAIVGLNAFLASPNLP